MKNKWIVIVVLLFVMGLLMVYIGYDKLVLDKENHGGNDNGINENGQNNSTPKVINIYKDEYTIADYNKNGVHQGKITCNANDCEFVQGYEKYAIVKQEEKHYLYNYLNDTLVLGPFELIDDDIYGHIFQYENELIGIYYQNMDKYNFYSVEANKSFPTIKGTMLTSNIDYDASVLKKYGYFAIDDEEKTNFINLNNGKVEFSIANTLHYIDEDDEKQNLYLSFYNENTEKYSVYNQLGKKLYDNVSSFTLKEKKY